MSRLKAVGYVPEGYLSGDVAWENEGDEQEGVTSKAWGPKK